MKICGIYKITSPSKKIYIGQSIDILNRWRGYENGNLKTQTKLYHSFKKYGINKHLFEVLCQCDKSELNNLEIYYIDLYQSYNSEYGLNLRAGGGCGFVVSDETRKKISNSKKGVTNSKIYTPERNAKISKSLLGKKLSLEHKLAVGRGNKGLKKPKSESHRKALSKAGMGHKVSPETRLKISQTLKKRNILN